MKPQIQNSGDQDPLAILMKNARQKDVVYLSRVNTTVLLRNLPKNIKMNDIFWRTLHFYLTQLQSNKCNVIL